MKNIHVLPTDKPSKLRIGNNGNFVIGLAQSATVSKNDSYTNQNIYITSDEYIGLSYYLDGNLVRKGMVDDKDYWEVRKDYKKIILTTDQDLIKDGVQAIDDDFLEWFVKNPSCESVGVKKEYITPLGDIVETCYDNERLNYKIIIPKEEPKQETLEEVAERVTEEWFNNNSYAKELFIEGVKWQQERMYSEEEVDRILRNFRTDFLPLGQVNDLVFNEWFEKFKKK